MTYKRLRKMGCTNGNLNTIKTIKVNPRVSASTIGTNTLYVASRGDTVSVSNCLKFRIKEQNTEEWEFIISFLQELSAPCLEEVIIIHRVYHEYEEISALFEHALHGVCVPKYGFAKGIMVMLIFLQANFGHKVKVKMLKEFPYLQVDGVVDADGVLDAFYKVLRFFEIFIKDCILKKALVVVKTYVSQSMIAIIKTDTMISKTILKNLNKALRLGFEVERKIQKDITKLSDFSKNYGEIRTKISNELRQLGNCAGESSQEIVHRLYKQDI